ncbi:ATP-binding cassette domain-containing protein [[Clostridium] polysaccharolyticum]|uniref:ABC-2 type transport system ATP-binding protein n=1 Tax=[Clostridium] polysaccharolyticum TaxID=29364 RepID=A0A1I0CDF2_9FIRM|nr:ATP-binding cassette domain-containing protein [[Clostridium] polysaccharolyticum]SET16956.1 ABC-2 type transport system ATP-binding protein [[Clostridium] polysaccharolyticum]
MEHSILETINLTKKFGNQKAVDCVNVQLNRGDIYGFIGKNGAGKTTFLKMISGLSTPTSGTIELFGCRGKEVNQQYSRVGVLIENPGIFPELSAYENLKLKCICAGIRKKGYINEILDIVGLSHTGKKKTRKFSVGMKQRLGIAMALIGEPELLILDEPINGLDPEGIAEIRDTIVRLNHEKKQTIIISSHILEELSKIANRYGIIDQGKMVKELTKEELVSECSDKLELKLSHPEKAVPVLKDMGFCDFKLIDSETIHIFEQLDRSGKIVMELSRQAIEIKSIVVVGLGIEEYFLQLTGGVHHA